MLEQRAVDSEEERLRQIASELPDSQRKDFYQQLSRQLRDPDTYAALNWFFLTGLHHFYLGRWGRGALDLGAFMLGLGLIFAQEFLLGVLLIVAVSLIELWALFRAQIVVQDWNNQIYRDGLQRQGISASRLNPKHQEGRR